MVAKKPGAAAAPIAGLILMADIKKLELAFSEGIPEDGPTQEQSAVVIGAVGSALGLIALAASAAPLAAGTAAALVAAGIGASVLSAFPGYSDVVVDFAYKLATEAPAELRDTAVSPLSGNSVFGVSEASMTIQTFKEANLVEQLSKLASVDAGVQQFLLTGAMTAINSSVPLLDRNESFWEARAAYILADMGFELALPDKFKGLNFLESETTGYMVGGGLARVVFIDEIDRGSLIELGSNLSDQIFGDDSENKMSGSSGHDLMYGFGGADVLDGGAGRDTLVGGAGNDWLGFTAAGLDNVSVEERDSDGNIYDGGTGNDRISGSINKDVYLFRRGDGFDYVLTHGGADDLQLIANVDLGNGLLSEITEDQVSFKREGLDLLVCINRDDDTVSDYVRIAAWFDNGTSANALGSVTLRSAVEGTVFRTWAKEEIESIALTAIGSEQGDTLTGLNRYRNVLQGRGGNDTLIGANGAGASTSLGDTFIGGAGDFGSRVRHSI